MALVFKDLMLDLTGVPEKDKPEVKDRVADLLYNEVLRYVAKGTSPVENQGKFKILDEDYAKKQKQGIRTPNLQLEGDLLREDLQAKALRNDAVRIGHFNKDTARTQGEKADGHNQHSSKAKEWAAKTKFPKRQYIPEAKDTFKEDILDKVERIISRYRVSDPIDEAVDAFNETLRSSGRVAAVKETTEVTSISLEDYLSDDYLAQLIGDRLL